MDAVQLVSSEVLGLSIETVSVGGKVYVMKPPTIRRMTGAAMYLGGIGEYKSAGELISSIGSDNLAKALSWLVQGDESLCEVFLDCDVNEVAAGVITGLSMIDLGNFMRLSTLARNVRSLIAKPRS